MSNQPITAAAPAAIAMWWDGGERAITAREKATIEEHGPSSFSIALVPATPAARWAANGQPDPHAGHYDCERAALALGHLTDDELANAVYLHGNEQPSTADLVAGKALSGIVYLTAAKERIRWLSRALAATGTQQVGEPLEDDRFPGGFVDAIAYVNELEELSESLHEKVFGYASDGESGASTVLQMTLHELNEKPLQVGEVQGGALGDDGEYYADQHGDGAWATYQRDGQGWVYNFGHAEDAEIRAKSVARELNRQVAAIAARQAVGQEPVAYQGRGSLHGFVGNWHAISEVEYKHHMAFPTRVYEVRPLYAAPPAQAVDLHRLVPPEWFSEQIGGPIDDLTPGQAWRQGFNQCRTRTLLLVEQAMGFPSGGVAAQGIDLVPRPMDTAPRDGTLVRLLVDFDENAIDDSIGATWTIGACNDDNVSEGARIGWQFAGWCWTHDHFTEGTGTPVGWLPLIGGERDAAKGVSHG